MKEWRNITTTITLDKPDYLNINTPDEIVSHLQFCKTLQFFENKIREILEVRRREMDEMLFDNLNA